MSLHVFFFYLMLIWQNTLIDFQMLSHPPIPGISSVDYNALLLLYIAILIFLKFYYKDILINTGYWPIMKDNGQ